MRQAANATNIQDSWRKCRNSNVPLGSLGVSQATWERDEDDWERDEDGLGAHSLWRKDTPGARVRDMSLEIHVARLAGLVEDRPWTENLSAVVGAAPGPVVFTTSFGLEDQAITHVIASARLAVRVATLDTGRLFEETQALHAKTRERYGLCIGTFSPNAEAAAALIARQGPNGFYDSLENRLACCGVRKVEPLRRVLAGSALWITGIRQEQSADRALLPPVEWDSENAILKFHPLLTVKADELHHYLDRHQVPVNPLHSKGYPSIGCAPCTRAVAPGEPARSGRWWWEKDAKQECGLHVHHGRLVRKSAS